MKNQINNKISAATFDIDEEFLFTAMMDYLNNNTSRSCFVKSVHAHSGFIDYHSGIIKGIKKIEIADLQLLNYNRKRRELRLCFIQAKYKRKFYKKNFISVRGDAFQLELLTERCNIIDSYNNGFPTNILNFTNYQSITSYGIFYIDKHNTIDFLFTLPKHLTPSKQTNNTTLYFSGSCFCPNPSCTSGIFPQETISICHMDGFEVQLLTGNIGAPVDHSIHPYISQVLNLIYRNTKNPIALEIMRVADFSVVDDIKHVSYISTCLLIT